MVQAIQKHPTAGALSTWLRSRLRSKALVAGLFERELVKLDALLRATVARQIIRCKGELH
jgi:hypothetical protein